jgi:hypothetical protein
MVAALSLIAAAVLASDDAGQDAAVASAIGLTLVPIAFAIAALGTGKEHPGISVMKSLGVFILLTLMGGLITPAVGIGVGLAAAAAFVIEPEYEEVWRPRLIAIVVFGIYIVVMMLVAPPASIFAVAVLPMVVIGLTDTMVGWLREGQTA